jgi:hypothetical protein
LGTSHQFGESLFGELDVTLGRHLRFLLESVQHVDRSGQPGRVDHAVCAGVVPYPDFFDALADGRHRLEIVRLFAALHLVQLVAGIVPGVLGDSRKHVSESPRNRSSFMG